MADRDDDDTLLLEELTDEIIQRYAPERLLQSLQRQAGKGEPLDWNTRNKFERKLGVDLADVRVYKGEVARKVTRAKGAEALTVGTTKAILMGESGSRSPLTREGRGLLAHELTHVAQDKKRLHPKALAGGPGPFTREDEAEAEAQEASEVAETHAHAQQGLTAEQYQSKLREETIMRVLELFDEEQRLAVMRRPLRKRKP